MTKLHEVVISGVSGIFPECDDFDEFTTKILEGVNLVTDENCRWTPGTLGVPSHLGKVKHVYEFDLGLFGISRKLVEVMDPNSRLSIMQSFRAVCDAGVNPKEISGSNTAVFMASFTSETEDDFITRNADLGTYGILANSRSMQANRVSFFLNLVGPSNQMDASWCGGAQVIMCAYDVVSKGLCDAAIIGASCLNLKPEMAVHYQGLGYVSKDGTTRSFSADAAGYARSEACVAMFLQRADVARRSYGTILGATTLYHGCRPSSYLELNSESLKKFLKDCYANAGVNPNDVAYLEAAGTASRTFDAKELNAVASVLCTNRDNPLLIGSVKTLTGHAEGASSLVSLAKALVALDRGIIPPNLHYSSPNPDVPALVEGKIQVVTKPTKLDGDLVAVNEMGLSAGCMSHVIVRRNPKPKRDLSLLLADNIPRLVLLCDRTEENIENSVNRLESSPIDEELVYLLNSLNKDGVKGNLYRGYIVLSGSESSDIHKQVEKTDDQAKGNRKPIWFLFSGMGSQWPTMGKTLMRIPVFAKAVHRCHEILKTKGLDLIDILTNEDPKVFDSILHSFVGIAAIQIGLVDVLTAVGIVPDGMIGHSVGELGCGYADGVLTLEQMILSSYARGKASIEATLITGTMAAVGMGYSAIKDNVPATVDVACHNSSVSCTLSGPTEDVTPYVNSLKNKGIFAKLVNVANIAYHSRYIQPAGPLLLDRLKQVVPEPKARSSKWISTSVPESQWSSELAQTGSAEYFTNNLLSAVLFEEGAKHVPEDAILIEIAPHGLLQAIVRKSHPKARHVPLTSRFDDDNTMFLLGALGKLYLSGVPVDVNNLYPPLSLPVSRGTIPVAQFYGWQLFEKFNLDAKGKSLGSVSAKSIQITMREAQHSYLGCHQLNDNVVLPNSFYIKEVVKEFMEVKELNDVCLEIKELKFTGRIEVPLSGEICELFIEVLEGSGVFCVIRGTDLAVISTGTVTVVDFPKTNATPETQQLEIYDEFNGQEVASFLSSFGLNMTDTFMVIKKIALSKAGFTAVVHWGGGFMEFLNGLFSLVAFYATKETNVLQTVENVELLTVDFAFFNNLKETDVEVHYDGRSHQLRCAGIRMLLPEVKYVECKSHLGNTTFNAHRFVPYSFGEIGSGQLAINICHQLIVENSLIPTDTSTKIRAISVGSNLFQDSLLAISKSSEQIELSSYATEQLLLEEQESSLRGCINWIVSAKPISSKVTDMIKTYAGKSYVLMPKINETDTNSEIFCFSSSFEKYSLSFIEASNQEKSTEIVRYSDNYISDLESKLTQANYKNEESGNETNFVFLVGKIDSQSAVLEILDDTKTLPHHNLLRFLLGESADSSLNFENGIVQKFAQRDLKMNVIWNGVWGSLRTVPEKSIAAGTGLNSPDSIYNFGSLVSSKEPWALGLNLKDVTGTLESDEIGALDYANSKTMGVATYHPQKKTYVQDEVLKWEKPGKWSVSEAATVPFLYSLASYILSYNNAIVDNNSILINRGLLPISQALITLALKEGLEVFSTVHGEEEKKQLQTLHPTLKSDNILDANSTTFHVTILHQTQGRGVYKVINTFKDPEMIKPCIQAVAYLGVYIGLSLAPAVSKLKMGMSIFISEVLAVGISAETILNLPNEDKVRLRNSVGKAIEEGHLQPFSKPVILPSDATNKDAEKILKAAKSKVVVKIDGQAQDNRTLNCLTDDSVVVINNRNDKSNTWIELCSWLSGRGARNITVVLNDTNISRTNSMRLNSLKEKYNTLKLSLVSNDCVSSEKSINKFISEKNNSKRLHSVFILNFNNRKLVNLIGKSLQDVKCAMVCIGNGGEKICEERNKRGLVSLCVRVETCDADANIVLDHLDSLLSHSKDTPIITMKKDAVITVAETIASQIPHNFNELHQLLLESVKKPKLVEIPSRSPRKVHSREVLPVFVFPGLRPQQVRRITRKLFFPTLEVRLPSGESDINSMASEIFKQIMEMPPKMITLLAEGWGGVLALHVAALLESHGKVVRVILVDSKVSLIVSEATQALENPLSLMSRYFNVPNKAKQKLNQGASWKETVQTIVTESKLQPHEEDLMVQSLDLLRNRLFGATNASPPSYKLKRPCYLFKIGDNNTIDQCGLDRYQSTKAIIQALALETEVDIAEWVSDEINTLVLHENPDAAYLPNEEFLSKVFLSGKSNGAI